MPVRKLPTNAGKLLQMAPRTLPEKWLDMVGPLELLVTESGRYQWQTPPILTLSFDAVESVSAGIKLNPSAGRITDAEVRLLATPEGTVASLSFSALDITSPTTVIINRVTAVLR